MKYKCKNCGHALLKHINPKTKKVTWLHYNRFYYGAKAINHKWCSKCEVTALKKASLTAPAIVGNVCENPEPAE